MKIQWTNKASLDLVRSYEHLRPVAPEAAARLVQQLAKTPDRLLDYPRIGEKLEAYEPREVRRIFAGNYELRYETDLDAWRAIVSTALSKNAPDERAQISAWMIGAASLFKQGVSVTPVRPECIFRLCICMSFTAHEAK
jgi:plasmid stabilization system protein ParE